MHIPPTQALRAFEAAARHLCYSTAADELGLTHGAVSHHIARLERDLGGIRLFARDGQRMLLTEQGQVLALQVRQGLRLLANAFDQVRAREPKRASPPRALMVSVLPSFAARWLVPRLPRFQAAFPEIDVALRPTVSLARIDGRDGVDLAIRYGPGDWAGLKSERLLDSAIFPVCSPSYRGGALPAAPPELAGCVLLRNPRQPWAPWFAAAGLDWPEPGHGPSYEDAGLLLQAAADGQGIALAREILAEDDLASRRLVRLFNVQAEDDYRWFVVWREPLRCDEGSFKAFLAWLRAEGHASSARPWRCRPVFIRCLSG